MANLSQIKREKMLKFLETLKEQHSDDESLIAINQIENELTSKKYGLVWEEHEEEVDVKMRTHIPVFTEVEAKEIVGASESEQYNFLLEGDNLHSLKLLEKTHKGKIDVIYIDPPYNTGNKDFKYDDTFVDKLDSYKNSKWLSFMWSRLKVAHKLLSSEGIIFISIDDNELYPLKMICDEIFGEQCFVTNLIWQKKTGASDAKGIATITEYILVYVKDYAVMDSVFDKNYEAFDAKRYRYKDEYFNERGPFYYDSLDRGSVRYSDTLNYSIKSPNGDDIYPNGRKNFENDGWTWKWSKEKVEWGIRNGFIDITPSSKKENGWAVRYKIYLNVDNENRPIEKSAPYKNLITTILNANAAADIKKMFNGKTVFQYSKPVGLMGFLLSCEKNKKALILDFFAGSGTTGQAVLEKNMEDGGNRHFILCTNNENNICEGVTYQRLKTVITGKCADGSQYSEGLPANLKYYKTDFVDKESEEIYDDLLEHTKEMIQLQYGVKVDNQKYIMIMDDDEMDEFEKHFDEFKDIEVVFINQDVLLSTSQEKLLQNINTKIIPDCYFDFELREVGELW
ncbi:MULTISPECIES: site-specific DNA-methyltransferase [Clostridia]|jgi:adenine-specific DNA-methyltransferase|uniref:site-specific DNA-methyltransferase n=1 Tax=Clostridia TaxID=186801 RepID=UPI000E4C0D23|nr:site-specific DNA-methyltransferase [Lachnospira eligens]RGT55422.1 site-specific DNA-methyltransferase [Lachnospira eligens]